MSASGDSIEHWVARVRPGLVRQAERILRDRAEAENVVQETLGAVWQAQAAGWTADVERYARRAVHLNALRSRARRREHVTLDDAAAAIEAGEHPALVAPADHDEGLSASELEAAVLGLPPAQQAVLRLRFYAGMSFKEIGHALAISMNTAASRCRYALRALRAALDDDSGSSGEGEQP